MDIIEKYVSESKPKTGTKKFSQGIRSVIELMWDKMGIHSKPTVKLDAKTAFYAEMTVEFDNEVYEIKIQKK